MNITFLLQDTGSVYGAERATMDLVSGLAAAGKINPHVLLVEETRYNLGHGLCDEIARRGIEHSVVPCGSAFSPGLALRIRRRLAKLGTDVLHTVGYKADVHGFLATRGSGRCRLVATVHGWLFRPDTKERFYGWADARILRHYDAVIALSSHYRHMLLQEGVPAKRLHLIPSGLGGGVVSENPAKRGLRRELCVPGRSVCAEAGREPDRYSSRQSSRQSFRIAEKCERHSQARPKPETRNLKPCFAEATQGKPDPLLRRGYAGQARHHLVTFGMLGRLSSEKNHTMFIRSLATLKERGMDFRALIAGDGPLRKDIESEILQKGLQDVVEMPGYMDATDFFRQIDVLVVCSRIESLPYSVLEAMRSGKPVIATRVGGLPDLVEDGRTGFLVELDAIEQLADRMVSLLRNPEKGGEMGDAARKRQEAEFSLDRMVARHVKLYEGLVGIS